MAKKVPRERNNSVPHPLLLALVAQFLERNGFNSSHRIYNTERRKRPKKEGWQGTFGRDYTAKAPSLEAIFQTWRQDNWKENAGDEGSESSTDTSSSEEKFTAEAPEAPEKDEVGDGHNSTSENSSDSESSDEQAMEERAMPKAKDEEDLNEQLGKVLKRKASLSSSESDSADSDSDDSTSESEATPSDRKPHAKKRRIEPLSPSSGTTSSDAENDNDSSSSSGSDSESESRPAPKASRKAVSSKPVSDSSSSTSDTSSDSESSSDEEIEAATQTKADSDSSATIVGDTKRGQESSDSNSSENAARNTNVAVVKKRHIGARPTKLAQMSATADPHNYISNTYVSYDYADKAYRDLSITRGKGFTKEKNKKKRGSYRGGAIDTSGGKAFKFDD